jgi:hypothetical protein
MSAILSQRIGLMRDLSRYRVQEYAPAVLREVFADPHIARAFDKWLARVSSQSDAARQVATIRGISVSAHYLAEPDAP